MTVSPRARLLDTIGIAMIVVGAVCYVIAHLGLARLQAEGVVLVAKGQAFGKMREFQHWAWLWWGGLTMITAGIAVALWASLHHRRAMRAETPPG